MKDKESKEAGRSSTVGSGEITSQGATADVNETSREADEDEENLLTSDDYIPDVPELACKIVKAEYKPRVDASLHFPSSSKVPLSAKLGDAADHEDYTSDHSRPSSLMRNNLCRFAMNQMEHRLINQGELQWFTSNGTVKTTRIAIGDKPYRLRSYDDNARAFSPRYTKAMNCVPYRCDSEPELELELDVSSLKFQHHPLFSSEHVLAAQLTSLYDAYAALALSGDQASPPFKEKQGEGVQGEDAEMYKPEPPADIVESEIADLVRRRIEKKREATECVYYLTRGKTTPAHQCPSEEQQRRQDVAKTSVHLRIMFNEKEVCKTDKRPLDEEFTVVWGQIFALRILQFPRTIGLEVYETRGVLSQKTADVLVPIPEAEHTTFNTPLAAVHFASEKTVSTSHAGVGCGVRLEVGRGGPLWLSLNGELTCSLAWADNAAGQNVVIRTGIAMNSRARVRQTKSGKGRLGTILNRSKLRALAQEPQGNLTSSAMLPLKNKDSSSGGGLEFCDKVELERNPRFSLLTLRNSGVAQFRDFAMVPLMINEYTVPLMEKIYAREARKESLPGHVHHDPIEARQARMSHAIKEMREEVLRQVYESQTHRVLEDIVIEEKMPFIGSLGFGLLKLAKRRRPLRPSRRERRRVTGQSAAAADAEILVTVLRASNVPVRRDTDASSTHRAPRATSSYSGLLDDVMEYQVRPFVEIMFQQRTARTFVADGPHPTWNQELRLPITPEEGVVKDVIYLNLFDEVVLDLLEDERERHSTVHQRLERRWLGSLKIPFSTLYINAKIEGTFRIDVPVVLLGYAHEVKPWSPAQDAPASSTYVSFYMTVEPGLQSPEVLRARCDSDEPPQLVQQAEEWQSSFESRYPRRFVKALAMDASGKWVFVPRFLKPLAPPQQLLDSARRPSLVEDVSSTTRDVMALAARFVSLIPMLSDSVLFPGLCDIWSTCDQFLHVLTGDEEEHALLLCNYFLHLGAEAYLLLGSGIPEGQTAYVLTRNASRGRDVRIWNAVTGRSYSVTDSYGPLQSVGCLVGVDNIWANVQKHEHPSRLSYNLSKSSHWKPFFAKGKVPPTLDSVQPSELSYEPTDPSYVSRLQQKIEYALKESVMKWRKRFRTSWNRYASQVLRKILPRLESMASASACIDDIQELSEILTSYKMSGFPLSMSFTDVETVIETVLSTGVHLTESRNVEFALAVHIHPYPSGVLAVWVYIAALTRKS
ncbi:coiled-coil and C2 domain containing 2A [Rhipicephalus microplus]|uniref:coiled-coil and C2 domain containing 2A n=1 Tax=Rhipicephalus microplus TaxID=6941 RepID=UPI003F6CF000